MRMLFTLLTFIFTASAFASDVEIKLEKRLTDVVRAYDVNAYVLVQAKVKNKNLKLPTLPFVFTNKNVFSENDYPELELLNVTIFSSFSKLPKALEDALQSIAKFYNVKASIALNDVQSELDKKEEKVEISFYVYGAVAGILLFLIYGFINIKSSSKMAKILESQLTGLAQAFEKSSQNSGANVSMAAASDKSESSGKTSIEVNTSASSMWEEYSSETLVAVLSDCYWCQEDQYAAFVWKRLPISKRNAIMDSKKVSSDYISFISNLEGIDKIFIDDPYYMSPLEISHIDNEKLLELVKENTALMGMLSQLRVNKLPLKAKERLMLFNQDSAETVAFEKDSFSTMGSSPLREIKNKAIFTFDSIEEEIEIVEMSDITVDNMEQFPSLAWVTKIDKEQGRDLLNSYTAKQLAAIWVAPESILSTLEELLPEKKKDLLKSYIKNVTPSRSMPLYQEIISEAVELYKSANEEEVFDKAA